MAFGWRVPPRLQAALDRDLIAFELEQYRALRAEIKQSMNDGNQIIGFGLAAIGLLVSSGIKTSDGLLTFVIFATLVPLFCGLVCSMWFAAQERTARASHFLTGVEQRVRRLLGTTPGVTWEQWLRSADDERPTRHFWSTEHAGFGLFSVIGITSLAYGIAAGDLDSLTGLKIVFLCTSVGVNGVLALSLRRRYQQWLRWLSTAVLPVHR